MTCCSILRLQALEVVHDQHGGPFGSIEELD
jgi:hypothetical protein